MNQRQHDSSYQPLAMDSSPQLPSGTNYTTSTIVSRGNRRTTGRTVPPRNSGIHGPGRLPAERRGYLASLEMLDICKLNARGSNLMPYQVCITTDPVPTTTFLPYQLRRASGLDGSNLNQRQHDSRVEHNPGSETGCLKDRGLTRIWGKRPERRPSVPSTREDPLCRVKEETFCAEPERRPVLSE